MIYWDFKLRDTLRMINQGIDFNLNNKIKKIEIVYHSKFFNAKWEAGSDFLRYMLEFLDYLN